MDAWDVLGVLGAASLVGGVAAVYWPAALILGGGIGLVVYYVREKSLASRPPARR